MMLGKVLFVLELDARFGSGRNDADAMRRYILFIPLYMYMTLIPQMNDDDST